MWYEVLGLMARQYVHEFRSFVRDLGVHSVICPVADWIWGYITERILEASCAVDETDEGSHAFAWVRR